MIESLIFLFCATLDENQFRKAEYLSQNANLIKVVHFQNETIFDIKGVYKKDGSNCYWVNIPTDLEKRLFIKLIVSRVTI